MKLEIRKCLIAFIALIIGAYINASIADNFSFAVVDVNRVISESAQVKSLRKEQQTKLQDLEKWLGTVQTEIAKQTKKEEKEKLIKKYDAEFAKKQETIKKNYAEKLQNIDKNISNIISTEAKSKGYKMVLPKGSVLYGGDDITDSIIKLVK